MKPARKEESKVGSTAGAGGSEVEEAEVEATVAAGLDEGS